MFKANIKLIVLRELEDSPMTGLGLIKNIKKSCSIGPSPGYMYPLLHSLNQKGLISAKISGRKKIYSITKRGVNFLAQLQKKREEHEKSMEKMLSKGDLQKHAVKMMTLRHEFMKNHMKKFVENLPYVTKYMRAVMDVYNGNYDKKKIRFRKIMENAAQEMSALAREK